MILNYRIAFWGLLALNLVASISLFFLYKGQPKNCGELGQAYMEIGKKRFSITANNSAQWQKLIDEQTKFTNDCYKSMK